MHTSDQCTFYRSLSYSLASMNPLSSWSIFVNSSSNWWRGISFKTATISSNDIFESWLRSWSKKVLISSLLRFSFWRQPLLQWQQNMLHPPLPQHGVPLVPSSHLPIPSALQHLAFVLIDLSTRTKAQSMAAKITRVSSSIISVS